jgi:hypothetical protein
MNIGFSAGAEDDVREAYWFYERQSLGLGDYFCSCIFADIESLAYAGGIHKRSMVFIDHSPSDFPMESTMVTRS